jgi:hypothetical protein
MVLADPEASVVGEGQRGIRSRVPRPSIDHVWGTIAVLVPIAATWLRQTMAIDLAYQIRAGQIMLSTHRLLTNDVFTFTIRGHPWHNQQWLAEVLLGAIWGIGGWSGISFAWGVLVGLTSFLVYRACVEHGAHPRTAALLTIAAFLVNAEILTMRPQLFGIVLFATTQWILATRQRAPRRVWLIPLLLVCWVNVHGSFPLAFVLLAIAWMEDRAEAPASARSLIFVAFVSAMATLMNPWGLASWAYVRDVAGNPAVSGHVGEWGPPSLRDPTGLLFFASVFGVVAILARRGRAIPWPTLVGLGLFAAIAIFAIRGIVWWGLAAPVLVSPLLGREPSRRDEVDRSWVNLVALFALLALVPMTFLTTTGVDAAGAPSVLSFAPQHLVAAVQATAPPGSRVLASEVDASWIEFSAPDLAVFVDPRIEVFPQDVWSDYFSVSSGRAGWESILDRWGVDALILDPHYAEGLLLVIGDSREWKLIARDESGSAYVRR